MHLVLHSKSASIAPGYETRDEENMFITWSLTKGKHTNVKRVKKRLLERMSAIGAYFGRWYVTY